MLVSARTMAFPANLRSFGETLSGPLDLLALSLFTFSSTTWFVSNENDGAGMRLDVMLPSTIACPDGNGRELIKFLPIVVKYEFILSALSLSISASVPSFLLRGPIALFPSMQFVALFINFQ